MYGVEDSWHFIVHERPAGTTEYAYAASLPKSRSPRQFILPITRSYLLILRVSRRDINISSSMVDTQDFLLRAPMPCRIITAAINTLMTMMMTSDGHTRQYSLAIAGFEAISGAPLTGQFCCYVGVNATSVRDT